VPAIVDALAAHGLGAVPVLAAGGIMDGRGIAAALALGAEGVFLGTRFAAARESGIFPDWRDKLLAAGPEDVVISRAATGRPARAVRNRLVAAMADGTRAGMPPLAFPHQAVALAPITAAARERRDADFVYLAAGQGIGALTQAEPAGEIVAKLVEGTLAALERLGA
jgi:nitronate monooxygenase